MSFWGSYPEVPTTTSPLPLSASVPTYPTTASTYTYPTAVAPYPTTAAPIAYATPAPTIPYPTVTRPVAPVVPVYPALAPVRPIPQPVVQLQPVVQEVKVVAPPVQYVASPPEIHYVQSPPVIQYVQSPPQIQYVKSPPEIVFVQSAPQIQYVQSPPQIQYIQSPPVVVPEPVEDPAKAKRIAQLEAELAELRLRMTQQTKQEVHSRTSVHETYKVKTFEIAARLAVMDGTDDGMYNGLPIEVEGEGLYRDLVAKGRRPKENVSLTGARTSSMTSKQTYKVQSIEMAEKLSKMDGTDDGKYNDLPIEVAGLGLYTELRDKKKAEAAGVSVGGYKPFTY